MEDMNDAITALGTGSYVVTRVPAGSYRGGDFVRPVVPGAMVASAAGVAELEAAPASVGQLRAKVTVLAAGVATIVLTGDFDQLTTPSLAFPAEHVFALKRSSVSIGNARIAFASGVLNETFDASTSSTFTIAGVIAPASGRQIERLPEGQRDKETIAIYTPTELRTASAGGAPADRITWGGRVYEVLSVKPWSEAGGFVEALAIKVGQ